MLEEKKLLNHRKLYDNRLGSEQQIYTVKDYDNIESFKDDKLLFSNFLESKSSINNKELKEFLNIPRQSIIDNEMSKEIRSSKKAKRLLNILERANNTKYRQENIFKYNIGYKLRLFYNRNAIDKTMELVLIDLYHLGIPTDKMVLHKEYKKVKGYNYNLRRYIKNK